MKMFLVGIIQDNGKLDHIRSFQSWTWAQKYGKSAGDAARYAVVDADFSTTPPKVEDDGQG